VHWYNFWTGCFTLSKDTVEYRKIFQLNFLKRNIENDAKRQYKLPDSLLHRVNELQTSTVKLTITHRVKTRTNHQGHRLDTKNSWKWLLIRDVISRTRPRVEDNNKPISYGPHCTSPMEQTSSISSRSLSVGNLRVLSSIARLWLCS